MVATKEIELFVSIVVQETQLKLVDVGKFLSLSDVRYKEIFSGYFYDRSLDQSLIIDTFKWEFYSSFRTTF